MITIIEGLDRCGKSTLVSNLRKHYFKNPKLIVHHSSTPPKGVDDLNEWEAIHYRELSDSFHYLSAKQGYDIICDRFHLGSIVYGMKYRGLNPYTIYNLESRHISKGHEANVALILLTDYTKNIISRDDGESLETSFEEFEYTRSEFIKVFGYSTIKHKLHINISDNGGFVNTLGTVTNFLSEI